MTLDPSRVIPALPMTGSYSLVGTGQISLTYPAPRCLNLRGINSQSGIQAIGQHVPEMWNGFPLYYVRLIFARWAPLWLPLCLQGLPSSSFVTFARSKTVILARSKTVILARSVENPANRV
jgi:hypothetical protein